MNHVIRIYLVDDHAILREGIRAILESDPGLSVVGEASDGESALEQLARWHEQEKDMPDVVLLDISLPGLNGIEVTKQLKAQHPEMHILILSMHENQEYVRSALQMGADGYVLKRLAGKELTSAIRAVASGHTLLHPDLSQALLGKASPDSGWRRDPETQSLQGQPSPDLLTARELEVLKLISMGHTNAAIAEQLHISIKTVQAHRANLMQKLDIHDALELMKFSLRHGLVKLD